MQTLSENEDLTSVPEWKTHQCKRNTPSTVALLAASGVQMNELEKLTPKQQQFTHVVITGDSSPMYQIVMVITQHATITGDTTQMLPLTDN